MSDLHPDHEEPEDLLAGEYALGVLDHQERAAAEARSERDPEFAADIFAWIRRFSALIDAVPSRAPSPELWPRIESGLDRKTAHLAPPPPAERSAPPPPANDDRPGVALWRTWALAATSTAAAALLAVGYLQLQKGASPLAPTASGRGATLVATLGLTEGGAPAMTVAYDPGRATLYASPDADFSIPKARSAELWLIPEDGKPRPMGVVAPSKPATMPMPPAFRALANDRSKLALSIEPEGGSPTGAPTGPVVAVGALSQV